MKATITKIYDFGKPRTDMPIGWSMTDVVVNMPKVGEQFLTYSMHTSTVLRLLPNNCFLTKNSIYQLEITK